FGPKTWSKDCSRYFLDEDLSEGGKHNYNINPIMDALLEGKRVLSIDIDYQHPAEQKAIEENDLKFHKKRIDQLSSITGQLEAHWNKLHPPKVK
ncbi:MAG: hypothetical protein Q7S74_03145, partial [Nanoarchaeota archaeon]|nr:hypothetical protein [Nanoarchaeota archaeon]